MLNYILNILTGYGINPDLSIILSNIILLIFLVIISILTNLFTAKVIFKIIVLYVKHNKYKWDDLMLKRKVFSRLCHIIPPLIAYFFVPAFSVQFQGLMEKIILIYITIIISLVAQALLNSTNDIYNYHTISKTKSIKGIIQILQIIVFLIAAVVIISNILDKSPVIILSGIGALTAVLLIIFKDSLLGLVSGIQIATNDLLRIGDWIEMSKYEANGVVVDISLNTIKVENFDKTITNIPSYAFISDSFKNWRHMQESGGRRIKRSIYIDSTSIEFCNLKMLAKFKKVACLSSYIKTKEIELEEFNRVNNINSTTSISARRLTNIGTFREYIKQYLSSNPHIHKDMVQMVRQLEPGINGVPLEIYAFTNDTNWANYEKIQGDIFDHILSIAPEFNIRIFQSPTGYDVQMGLQNNSQI
jgi:miniconductance mechanosensitive channel